ncbi:MAG: hypothetical protein LBE75_05105 [Burkholderiales bacterium]|jgi:Tfp pilus assembly protein PilF|nr:hypothetical protein [Burkholderiales bacterium]
MDKSLSSLATRTTIGLVYVEGSSVNNASQLLQKVLSNAIQYDTAYLLFSELQTLGFSPAGVMVNEDTASAIIVDPNIGQVRICCHHIKVMVH